MPTIMPIRDLRNTSEISEIAHRQKEPIFITKNGYSDLVVMSAELYEKFARENLPEAELIIHDVNEEIPGLIAQGEADVMITEILEAGYYCAKDDRLAAPLINDPFTRGQLGVLLPKGNEELLDYVNTFIAKERESGRLEELAQHYIYGKDVEAETIPSSSDPVPALQP